MEMISRRSRSGYNSRSSPKNRRNLKVARLGAERRSWRLRLAPKLPVKMWYKMKNVMNAAFGAKRINPKNGDSKMEYSRAEFENRLVFEIYKSISTSLELGYTKQ